MGLKEFIDNCPLNEYKYEEILLGDKLGEGGQAPVYRCKIGDREYASKVYDTNEWCKTNDTIDHFFDMMAEGLQVGKKLEKSKMSMKTYGYSYYEGEDHIIFMILMELLVCDGDLSNYIADSNRWWTACYMKNNKLIPKALTPYIYYNKDDDIHWCYRMPINQKIRIVTSLIKSIKELHCIGVIHGDLKTANIVLEYGVKRQMIRLIDFDNSRIIDDYDGTGCPATMGYCSPEQHNYEVSIKSDIYSLAVVIIEVWVGEIWYDGESFSECRKEVFDGLAKIGKKKSEFVKLLTECLSLESSERPTAKEVLDRFYRISFY